ncbi:MAG: hypothetical protein KAT58_10030, partial [candidate division Zixibacteria bacterium]|nr:hypothetical protein [candidate division Zixibacteria bacterium]
LGRLDPTVTFIGSANKLDMRKSFAKNLAKQCTVVELKELSNRVLPGYIRSRFAARGLAVDEKGIIEFCRVVGRDCGEIENEAEKISILFADRKSLGYEDIRDYLSRSRHFSRYEAAEYLAHRQLGGALTSLQKVLAVGGGEARGMIWAYYQQLERMLLYKRLADTIKPDDLAGRLRMPVFLLKQLAQQASKWTDDQLLQALAQVYQCEVGQRFTPQPREHIWERALIRMIGEKRE